MVLKSVKRNWPEKPRRKRRENVSLEKKTLTEWMTVRERKTVTKKSRHNPFQGAAEPLSRPRQKNRPFPATNHRESSHVK